MTDPAAHRERTGLAHGSGEEPPRRAYVAVLPVKRTDAAKSRLLVERGLRHRLALAFAADTAAALLKAARVLDVVVVTDEPLAREALGHPGLHIAPEPHAGGLLAAIRHGRRIAARLRPEASVLVLPSDLPALTGLVVDAVLAEADAYAAPSFVPDASGLGTTFVMLHGTRDEPRYGVDSAARHGAAGFTRLVTAPWAARRDVDTVLDLREALLLGSCPRTRGVLRQVDGFGGAAATGARSTAPARLAHRPGAMSA